MTHNSFKENYEHILNKMTNDEKNWARNFEAYNRALQRSDIVAAKEIFVLLRNREPNESEIKTMNKQIQDHQRSSFSKAKAQNAKMARRNKGQRKRFDVYDSSDWLKNPDSYLDQETNDIIEKGVTSDPTDGIIEAINESQLKKCSLERLVEDYKLSKIAKADLMARTQKMTYEAMTYTFHGTQYMNLNYILKGVNGQLYVQDQHDRIQSTELYLKRQTSDSFATHAEVWYPGQPGETWIFQPGPKSNIEGKAVKYEVR